LRIAQAYRAEGDLPAAATEYARIAALADYPQVHRLEAAVQAGALRRVADGRPARDPEASRTRPATLDNFAAEIFVAPTGRDTNPGSQAAPVATLTRARDLVPGATGKCEAGRVAVTVLPGRYPQTGPIELTAE